MAEFIKQRMNPTEFSHYSDNLPKLLMSERKQVVNQITFQHDGTDRMWYEFKGFSGAILPDKNPLGKDCCRPMLRIKHVFTDRDKYMSKVVPDLIMLANQIKLDIDQFKKDGGRL